MCPYRAKSYIYDLTYTYIYIHTHTHKDWSFRPIDSTEQYSNNLAEKLFSHAQLSMDFPIIQTSTAETQERIQGRSYCIPGVTK